MLYYVWSAIIVTKLLHVALRRELPLDNFIWFVFKIFRSPHTATPAIVNLLLTLGNEHVRAHYRYTHIIFCMYWS